LIVRTLLPTGHLISGWDQWHQIWTDGGASIIDIRGGMEQGSMVMVGTIYYLAESIEKEFRGRWTPLEDGRVRQFFEERDETGEWKTWFEGYYTRNQSRPAASG
jgi:hypothetical protein